jgi:hypothetical protein
MKSFYLQGFWHSSQHKLRLSVVVLYSYIFILLRFFTSRKRLRKLRLRQFCAQCLEFNETI